MQKLETNELLTIVGGVNISGALINSLTTGINRLLDLGRALGTAIRRVTGNKLCPIR